MVVWQLADELRRGVYELAMRPTVRRDFRFAGQFQDCAASISRNIAEGFGRIRPREFTQFLFIARGSASELQDHLTDGITRGYWTADDIRESRIRCLQVLSAIDSLIGYLRTPEAEEAAAAVLKHRPQRTDRTKRKN